MTLDPERARVVWLQVVVDVPVLLPGRLDRGLERRLQCFALAWVGPDEGDDGQQLAVAFGRRGR